MTDSDPTEIVRRLALLDRKLNYIAGLGIAGAALLGTAIAFMAARKYFGDPIAFVIAVIAGGITGRVVERPFRRADP